MVAMVDLTGSKCGRLFVISKCADNVNGCVSWLCRCDCGNTTISTGKSLRNGNKKSCGCLHLEHSMRNVRKNEKPIGYERIKKQKGYIEVKTVIGFRFKHVVVMENYLGRRLANGEVVHHIDHNKRNNELINLRLMTHGEHSTLHNLGRRYNVTHKEP